MILRTREQGDLQRLEWLALVVVLLLAGYLRLSSPGIVEYKRDEANLSWLALDFANGGSLPLLGIGSSTGIPNAPFNVYILAIPYTFSSNPKLATQFIGLLNILAIALTYLLARRYCNPWVALLAVLLFATNPWAIHFSRKIWAQNMLPLFAVMTVSTGIIGFVQGKRWAQLAHLPLLVVTGQIHYAAFVIIPVTIYLLWYGRRRLTYATIAAVVVALLLAIPYGIGMMRAGYASPGTLREGIATSDVSGRIEFTGAALRSAALLTAGTEIHSLAGPEAFEDYLASVPGVYPLWNLVAWAVLLGAFWLAVRAYRSRDRRTPVDIALLIWLGFPMLVFSVTWTPFFIHYLILVFPAAYLVLGFAGHDLWQALAGRTGLRWAVFGFGSLALAAILASQVFLWMALLDFVDRRATPRGFGTPLHYLLDVRDTILAEKTDDVIGGVGGQFIGIDDGPTIWATLLYDVPSVRFEDTHTRVYPAETAIYLTDGCQSGAGFRRFPLREGEGCYVLGRRSRSDFDRSGFKAVEPTARFANGVELRSYRWEEDPQMCLSLAWHIMAFTTEDYMFAVHVFDAQGERVAISDGLSWPGRFWRPDDLVVREFCLAEKNDAIDSVLVGMYTYDGENFFNVNLLDENGVPVGQMVELLLR